MQDDPYCEIRRETSQQTAHSCRRYQCGQQRNNGYGHAFRSNALNLAILKLSQVR